VNVWRQTHARRWKVVVMNQKNCCRPKTHLGSSVLGVTKWMSKRHYGIAGRIVGVQ
jgi:hypothetical protein